MYEQHNSISTAYLHAELFSNYLWRETFSYIRNANKPTIISYATCIWCALLYSAKEKLTARGIYDIVKSRYLHTVKKYYVIKNEDSDAGAFVEDTYAKIMNGFDSVEPNLSRPDTIIDILISAEMLGREDAHNYFPEEREAILFSQSIENVSIFLDRLFTPSNTTDNRITHPAPAPVWNTKPHYVAPPKKTMDNPPMDEGHALTLLICTISAILGAAAYFILH